ncbi:MFS transporter [Ostreibacterium oceani]|uniref:MFS transporter n=1 Tax=Ostreibacterium oceani TaxID=2654998 RepID=A0A6N7EYM7_9GAMM|nr:MFS transporter [Ostreibacterium oceani]MPV86247.1 MFS transporter [Ostreibacterium oceani]
MRFNLAYGAGVVLVPIIIDQHYHLGLDGFSLFMAAQGCGALVANLLLRRAMLPSQTQLSPTKFSRAHQQVYHAPFYGFIIVAIGLIAVALWHSLPMLIVFGFVGGCGLPLMDIYMPSLIHSVGNAQHHGRLFAIWRFFADFGMVMGFALSGLLTSFATAPTALTLIAVLTIPASLYGLYRFNRSHKHM